MLDRPVRRVHCRDIPTPKYGTANTKPPFRNKPTHYLHPYLPNCPDRLPDTPTTSAIQYSTEPTPLPRLSYTLLGKRAHPTSISQPRRPQGSVGRGEKDIRAAGFVRRVSPYSEKLVPPLATLDCCSNFFPRFNVQRPSTAPYHD